MKRYVNGNYRQPVYQTTECREKEQIGSLNPNEVCECWGIKKGVAIVCYNLDNSEIKGEEKLGFVKDLSGIQ